MELIKEIHKFEYSDLPEVIVRTPGRFHLIGEHSWFFRDKTLSMAVNLPVYVAASSRNDNSVHFYFPQLKDHKKVNLASLKFKKEDRWANTVKAILFGLNNAGFDLSGMNITIHSEILPSAGFGISTAMKIGVAWAVRKLLKLECDDGQLLRAIEIGNRKFLGAENYVSDFYAAIFSQEKSIILTDHSTQSYENIPFDFPGKKILLVDAQVPRIEIWNEDMIRVPEYALLLGELKELKTNVAGGWRYEENPHEVNLVLSVAPEDIHKKLHSIMKEHEYLLQAYEGLKKGAFGAFARAVNMSHENMRDEYQISCPEIDWIEKRLLEIDPNNEDSRNPFTCGRITGKGFGRCFYAILDEKNVPEFKKKLSEFTKIFGFHASCYEVEPARGVEIVL
ncbi:MAG: galactokinase [Treponema sp.]|nr:galactokinase [Candidatus Treponema equifaecale]